MFEYTYIGGLSSRSSEQNKLQQDTTSRVRLLLY